MPGQELMIEVCAAALGLGRWAVELLTIAEYSGLDNATQHLAMFKMAQLVRTPLPRSALLQRGRHLAATACCTPPVML